MFLLLSLECGKAENETKSTNSALAGIENRKEI